MLTPLKRPANVRGRSATIYVRDAIELNQVTSGVSIPATQHANGALNRLPSSSRHHHKSSKMSRFT